MKNYEEVKEFKNYFQMVDLKKGTFEVKKLKYLPYGQAMIQTSKDDNITINTLVSYTTPIISIIEFKNENITIIQPLTYTTHSATTRRHISTFGRQFDISYYDLKKAIINQVEMHL